VGGPTADSERLIRPGEQPVKLADQPMELICFNRCYALFNSSLHEKYYLSTRSNLSAISPVATFVSFGPLSCLL